MKYYELITPLAPIISMCIGFYIARLHNQGKIWRAVLVFALYALVLITWSCWAIYQAFTE